MKTALIVEDDVYVSRMFGRAFQIGGYTTEFAGDGEMALKSLLSTSTLPSVVIMDGMMPHMSGYELLRKMKEHSFLKDVPTVVLTNSFLEADEKKFMALHADLYLVKIEHSSKDVVKRVDEMLVKKGVGSV